MKKQLFCFLFFLILAQAFGVCAVCTKPNYIPPNYNVVRCNDFVGQYINTYVVENNLKQGVYTNWDDVSDYSIYPFDAAKRYNKIKVPVEYDSVEVVKNGFIVSKNSKFGYYHIDKGKIFDVKYDKIYLSNDEKYIYAVDSKGSETKKNPDNHVERCENMLFNIFIRPAFFWLDDALPDR